MATKSAELLQPQVQQGEAGGPPAPPPGPPPAPPDHMRSRGNNTVFKSGPLFISSKGIGWTSWKKRWFILTRTSLVFFRSDPSAVPQKGGEVNLTLGGIDLNNSGSVVVKADKKLLTVLFPDGRDGRAFTLKAETMEDLYEWKNALEDALAQAPSASHVMGQNGILRNDQADAANDSVDKVTDKLPMRATIIGTPVLLALEDVDGAPSFLEKALRFVEEHGVKVEGILRQAADVEDVERRIREYEQGKTEFSPEEDAHVVADCVKYVLRELPSSPVPASCCNALLEACRTDRGGRVNAMRTAICETFPEPNRHLLQRILMMMQTVASHRAVNRMSSSAVAACMAPLLLRPLLSGDCEIETDFDVGGDGSVQLLKAAAAANHAQAIVITLLEEYENIFGANSLSSELYSDTEESGSESEEATDDDESYEDYDQNDDATEESEAYSDDDLENAASETCSDSGKSVDNDLDDDKGSDDSSSGSKSPEESHDYKLTNRLSSSAHRTSPSQQNDAKRSENIPKESTMGSGTQPSGEHSMETNTDHKLTTPIPVTCIRKSSTLSNGPGYHGRQWGRTSAKKNLSMESIDYPIDEDDVEIQRLEATKSDLQNRVAEEVKANAVLQANLERRKKALHERRLALEKDVARLQDQLQKESDKREALEAGLNKTLCAVPDTVDEKTKAELQEVAQAQADITNLKQKFDHLEKKLNQQREQNLSSIHDSCSEPQLTSDHLGKLKDKQKDIEAAASSHVFERSTKKHTHLDRTESENEKQQESSSLQNKHAASNIQSDPVHNSNYRSSGVPVNSFAAEPALAKSTPMNSKRSVPRAEGTSTSSALTKLTTRLNFLKERRNQIASELQSVDKSRGGSGQAGPISDKGRRTGPPHSVPYPDKDRGWDTFQSVLEPDKGAGVEGESLQNSEKFRRTDKSHQDRDAGKRLEAQHPQLDRGKSEGHVSYNSDHPQLDRGKSEGHVSYNSDKTRGLGSHPPVASPRTCSR